MGKYALDMDKYIALARRTAAEGCVLLKNDNHTLPLRKGARVAVFGKYFRSIIISLRSLVHFSFLCIEKSY